MTPPFQSISIGMESRIFREKNGFSGEIEKFPFAGGASGIEDFRDLPVVVGCGSDEVAVHGPVVVFAEGEAVGGVVVVELVPRKEVGGVDERDILGDGELDAQAAGGALVIVDFEDLAAERGAAAVFGLLVCDAEVGLTIDE